MAAKKGGRLDQSSLEKALQEAFNDQQPEASTSDNAADEPSGLKAPQCTKLLNAQELAELGLDDEDERLCVTGPIDVDSKLVTELNKKLSDQVAHGAAASSSSAPKSNDFPADLYSALGKLNDMEAPSSGLRAPQPTVKLSAEALAGLGDDDDEDQLAGIVNDDEGVFSPSFLLGDASGLRAPEPTKLVTADMLAGLDDEDDIPDMDMPQGAPALPQPAVQPGTKNGVGFDVNFADSLQKKLQIQGSADEDRLRSSAANAPEDFASPDDEVQGQSLYMTGLKAPRTTQNLTAAQLALLDDDDIPDMGAPKGGAFDQSMPSPEQMATLTAAAMALQEVSPALEQFRPTSPGMALTMDSVSATKVIQTARDWPEGIDMWGQPKPLTSSCKLRLAWLSKDEIGKENAKLRKEINSLRAEIDMHRKEGTLARKV